MSVLLLLSTSSEALGAWHQSASLRDSGNVPARLVLLISLVMLCLPTAVLIFLRRPWALWLALGITATSFGAACSENFRDRDAIDGMFSTLFEFGALIYLPFRLYENFRTRPR